MDKNSKIYIAGHKGMVGSSIVRKLINDGYNNLITKSSLELDLRSQQAVNNFFEIDSIFELTIFYKINAIFLKLAFIVYINKIHTC
jgi:nucleoside-diphosphate-sugar epimerase